MKWTNISLVTLFTLLFGFVSAQNEGLPANPEPGKCYIKCVTPDEFDQVEETVMVRPGYSELRLAPAVYKTVYDTVLVKEASKRYNYIPAVYETVEIAYTSKEGRTDYRVVPAAFGSDSKSFETYPQTEGWEFTMLEDCPDPDKRDCQTLCWKEYPAQTRTVSLQTLVSDAKTGNVPVAEKKASYTKQIVKTPARMDEIEIPAVYDVIPRQVLVTPERVETSTVEPVYETVTRTVLKKKGGVTVWEEIDCSLTEFTILPILYDFNSAALTNDAKRIIDQRLLSLLNDKPNISIELNSHTDARGNDGYNQALSQRRAQSVVNYLISKGISSGRLVAKGYGESRLKNRCANGVDCSEEEHQINRRTEFRVIGG